MRSVEKLTCRPVLRLPGMLALDQPADHRDLAERGLEQVRAFDPVDELLLEDVGARTAPCGSVIGSSP